jgi:hypothetical protein
LAVRRSWTCFAARIDPNATSEAELFRSPKITSALDEVFCSALEGRGRHPANPAGLWFSMMLPVLD